MKVIFILGSGHCGSTLLDIILGSYPGVCGIGELHHYGDGHGECACGQVLNNCEFWKPIINQLKIGNINIYRKKLDFFIGKNNYYLLNKERKEVDGDFFVDFNEKLYKQISRASQTDIIVDSSKCPDRVELLSQSRKIKPYIIHLVRDGRAVTWSYYKKYKKILPFINKWLASNIKIEILKRRKKIKTLFIRYNDLVDKPEETLRKIFSLAEIDYRGPLPPIRSQHQWGGNRMRFNGNIQIKADNEWKEKMPLIQKFLFNVLAGWLNYYYARKKY